MLFYIIPYIFIAFLSLKIYYNNSLEKVNFGVLLFLILPAFLLVILRGGVGTDTNYYFGFFRQLLLTGRSNINFEPGFKLLGKAISLLGMRPMFGVVIIAVFTTLLLCKAFSKSKEEMILFSVIFFPMFYYDFTVNGIRYGLSFALATFAIDGLYGKKYWKFGIFAILAFFIQYSSLIIIVTFLISLIKKRYILLLSGLFIVSYIFVPHIFTFILKYFSDKADDYQKLYAPSVFSGLAPLLLTLLLYVSFLLSSRKTDNTKLIHLIFIGEILAFILSKYTYAGLRVQGVFQFTMILYIKNNIKAIAKPKLLFFRLFLIGVLAFLVFIKNIKTKVEGDVTPFLPYHFYWQDNLK